MSLLMRCFVLLQAFSEKDVAKDKQIAGGVKKLTIQTQTTHISFPAVLAKRLRGLPSLSSSHFHKNWNGNCFFLADIQK
ncbi:hypothetical protein [Thalassolituus sp.]|uniref:hypothetical protein n=1 Tax=Thalassolituus sp. TaxID=2030822 RepID=UPI003512CBDE